MKKDSFANTEEHFFRPLHYIGSWYEADPILLEQQINGFFSRVTLAGKKNQSPESICALVVPHAGYFYSGAAAAAAYKAVIGKKENRIFLLGPSGCCLAGGSSFFRT